jgi:capsular polysaccharide biosynthesis protein
VNPTFPNRLLFTGGGLFGGIMIGFGIALMLEMRDKSIRTEADIDALLQLPTLALVPSVLETKSRSRNLLAQIRKSQDDRALPAAGD